MPVPNQQEYWEQDIVIKTEMAYHLERIADALEIGIITPGGVGLLQAIIDLTNTINLRTIA